jgi:hypothetical protein
MLVPLQGDAALAWSVIPELFVDFCNVFFELRLLD